jgi:hypothetical protein
MARIDAIRQICIVELHLSHWCHIKL